MKLYNKSNEIYFSTNYKETQGESGYINIGRGRIMRYMTNYYYNMNKDINNIQLLPSNEVNIKSCQPENDCFPKSFTPSNLSRVDNSYEGNNCFVIYRNYS